MLCLDYSNLQERRNVSKLYLIAREHLFPVCGLRNECASRYFLQEKDVPTGIWVPYKTEVGKVFADVMFFLNKRRHLPGQLFRVDVS